MPESRARAAFLDRDGTVIVEKDYLADPDRIQFVAGAIDALKKLNSAGYKLIIVTNQSGIARGLYSLEDYRAVESRMEELLARHDVVLDAVFFCPHHPGFTGPCECRKPGLGMYQEAARKLDIDLAASVYVGDRIKDVEPAIAVGGRGILVSTGHGMSEMGRAPVGVEIARDLAQAADMIVGKIRTAP